MADIKEVTAALKAAITNTDKATQACTDAAEAEPYDDDAYEAASQASSDCAAIEAEAEGIAEKTLKEGADITALLKELDDANTGMADAAAKLSKDAQSIKDFASAASTVLQTLTLIAPFFV